ncbi:MAG: AbrB/MazE/SpoVT family DNA-binding domain-containing protein [Promethearchaeota archaeon]
MKYLKKVTEVGNSLAIYLPKEVRLLGFGKGDDVELYIDLDKKEIVIRRHSDSAGLIKTRVEQVLKSGKPPQEKVATIRDLVMESYLYKLEPGEGEAGLIHVALIFLDDNFPLRNDADVVKEIEEIVSNEF